jgi:uncharacterized protein YqeY
MGHGGQVFKYQSVRGFRDAARRHQQRPEGRDEGGRGADIEARGQGKPALSDEDALGVLQKMIKQRHESVELYEKGGRPELAAQEREEITIISKYLPQQMTDQEIHDTIGALLKETGATAMKDMGRVMAALKERYAGKLDFAKASGAVKKMLSGG